MSTNDLSPTPLEALTLALCAVPSHTGEEGPVCDLAERWLVERLGRAAVVRDGHSLLVTPALPDGPRERERVLLAGHFDVVRTEHTAPPRLEGERLYGPGAADMKSGVALMLLLAERAAREAPRYAPTFVFYEREEGPYEENSLGPLLARHEALRTPALAVCLEPSDNVLQHGCVGSMHARVTFAGRTAHSARPWQGDNAIYRAAPFLARMAALEPREVRFGALAYREVTTVTLASGGRGRNVVPDRFELNVNARFAPGRTSDDAERELRALVAGEASVEVLDRSPSALPHAEHPLVRALEAAGVAGVAPKQAWTDVARFSALGVPAVNLGPGTAAQAHQRDEYTERASLAAGQALFERWLFG